MGKTVVLKLWQWIVVLVVLVVLAFLVVWTGLGTAYDRWGPAAAVIETEMVVLEPLASDREVFERELIEELIGGLKSAEINIEYDQSGYSRGVIVLYWER